MIRANFTIRCQVEEGIVITVIVVLPVWPALVCLIAGTFDGGPGSNIDLNCAIEEFTG